MTLDNLSTASRLARPLLAAALVVGAPGAARAQQTLVSDQASFSFTGQSMWGPGDAFLFDYSQFLGIDTDPAPLQLGSGSGDAVSVDTFLGTYSLDPYFQFDTDFKLGVELGASINSGSVDGSLDYGVSLAAPDRIQVGQPFSLTGSAAPLASSGFTTRAPTAQAYVDGILEAYVGGYARFDYVAPGPLADQDMRWGNRGFTTNDTNNRPYATLANIVERQEIVGVNRDASGVVRYFAPNGDLLDGDLLYDQVGKGSSVSVGPVELTAGNIDVVATGALAGSTVVGSGQDTLASVGLDIDQMLLGSPALGLEIGHDFGIVDYSLGYDLVDLDTGLDILLQQDFQLAGDVLLELVFSGDVMLEGIGTTDHWTGPIDQIPLVTLLAHAVDVDATLLVEAMLSNDTRLGFVGSLTSTLLAAHADVAYDVSGRTGSKGYSVGPVWSNEQQIGLGSIGVYDDTFSLGLAPVGTWSFQLVPEPATSWLMVGGLLGLLAFGRRRPGGR